MEPNFIEFSFEKVLHLDEGSMLLQVEGSIPKGSISAIYGPSKSGKGAILRLIAGFDYARKGYLRVDGEYWYHQDSGKILSMAERPVGSVFKNTAVLTTHTVRENIAIAQGYGSEAAHVEELIDVFGLRKLTNRLLDGLNEPEIQLVLLARALAAKPKVLILDKPFAGMDTASRVERQRLLLDLHQRYSLTTIFVSHYPEEVMQLADWVYPLEDGCLRSAKRPAEYFMNMPPAAHLSGRILGIDQQGKAQIIIENRMLEIDLPDGDWQLQDRLAIGFDTLSLKTKKL